MPEYTPPGHKLVANPKVSVCITTYNHEKYIAQALDSVLAQETDFPYEIIVGEDESSDRTRAICMEYKERYPGRVRLFLNSRENVIYIEGLATGRANLLNNFQIARGEYVAMLEGDDYWIDSEKLKRQANLLDTQPKLSFCFHRAWVENEESGSKTSFHDQFFPPPFDTEGKTEDLFFQWFVPSASMFFRRSMLPEFPAWYRDSISGDHGLQLLLSTRGNFAMLDRFMSTYRQHPGGLSNYLEGDLHRRNWYQMHHQFNAMFKYRFNNAVAPKLEPALREFAFLPWKNFVDARRSFSELWQSIQYARKAENVSFIQSIKCVARWIRFHLGAQIRARVRRKRPPVP